MSPSTRFKPGFTPVFMILALSAITTLTAAAILTINQSSSHNSNKTEQTNINTVSQSITAEKLKSSSISPVVAGTVLVNNTQYSAYKISDAQVKEGRFVENAKIRLPNGEFLNGQFKNGKIPDFILGDDTKTPVSIVDRATINVTTLGGQIIPLKLIEGKIVEKQLQGFFIARTFTSGLLISGYIGPDGKIISTEVNPSLDTSPNINEALASEAQKYLADTFTLAQTKLESKVLGLSTDGDLDVADSSNSLFDFSRAKVVWSVIAKNTTPTPNAQPNTVTTIRTETVQPIIASLSDKLIVNQSNNYYNLSLNLSNSINSESIIDGQVKEADIENGAITNDKLATITQSGKVSGSAVQLNPNGGLTNNNGLGLTTSCAQDEILIWDGSGWVCGAQSGGGGGGNVTVQENDSTITSAANTIDFNGTDFSITNSPSGEANIVIDYANSGILRSGDSPAAGDVSGSYTSGFTIGSNSVALGTDTTGNYVATVSGNSQISVSGSGSESATISLSIVGDSIGDGQLEYNTGQNLTSSSSPTFLSEILSATSNQLVFGTTNTTTISSIAPAASRTATIPALSANDTFAFLDQTQTLTNKTISGSSNTLSNIANSSLTNSSITINTAGILSGGAAVSLGGNITLTATEADTLASVVGRGSTASAITLTTLNINGDAFTDLTGTGLTISGGSLQAVLGTSISNSEIDNDAVTLGTQTTGNYVSSATANKGLTLTGTEGGSLGLKNCADSEILKYSGGVWDCATDSTGGSINSFETISVSNGTSPIADSSTDTLTLTDGSGITITGNSTSDTITIASVLGTSISNSEIDINAVTLATQTTGNYVATVTGNSQISVSGSGSENAGVSLSIAADSIGDSQLAFNTGQNLTTASSPAFASNTLSNTTNQLVLGATNTTTISSTAPAASRVATIPALSANDTFAFVDQAQTLTNKTISGASNTISNIGNAALTNSSITINSAGILSGGASVSLGGNITLTATEADTLASVTGRGATTSTALTLSSTSNAITAGTITVSGDAITDFTGTGITISAGALQAVLGTSISNSEIDNDAVTLGTQTTGNYVSSATANKGLTLTGTEGGSLGIKNCADNEILKYNAGTWDCATDGTGTASNSFETFSVSNGTSPIADSATDTLTLTDGSGITITGNSTSDTITIASVLGTSISNSEIDANAVTLATQTTGNYVATVAGNSQISVSGSGSEDASVTLSIAADSIGDSQLAFNTGQNLTTASSPSFASSTLSNTTNQLVLGVTNTTTISSTAPAANRTATIPALSANDTFAFLDQAQTLTNKTISGASNTITNIGNAALTNSSITINSAGILSGGATVSLGGNVTLTATEADTLATVVGRGSTASAITLTTLNIGGDAFTDLTGTGLTISGGVLQTTLGTSIANGEIDADAVTLGTQTTGNYVSSATANGGLALTGTEGGSLGIVLPAATDALSATTSSGSGLELTSSGLSLIQGCANNEVLKWNETSDVWACGTVSGSFTSFIAAGDTGGGQTIADSNTLSILGGTNGIDTVDSATDTITLNLDTTEINTTTFGSNSNFTWTFNGAGTTDPQLVVTGNGLTLNTQAGSTTISGATADTTLDGSSISSNGTTFDLLGSTVTTLNIADSTTTKTIDIGGVTASGTDTINISTNGTAADTISIGNSNASTTTTITGGDDWSITSAGIVTTKGTANFNKVNTAGGSANSVTLSGILGAFDGSDTFRGLYLNYTNADHTGSANNLVGIDIASITPDAQATETALNIGDGWDVGLSFGNTSGNYIAVPDGSNLIITDGAQNYITITESSISANGYFQSGSEVFSSTGLSSFSNTNIGIAPDGTGDILFGTDSDTIISLVGTTSNFQLANGGVLTFEDSAGNDFFTVTDTGTAGTIAVPNLGFLDLGAITHGTTAVQGLRLPQNTTLSNPISGEGYLAWDTDDNVLKVFDGSSWSTVSGSSSTLQQAYVAGNSIDITSGEGALAIDAQSANVDFEIGQGTDTGDFRIWNGTDTWFFIDESANTLALGAAAGSGITFGGIGITTTNAGALTVNETLTTNGTVTLGDGGDTITINGSSVTLQTTGAGSDITLNAVDQILLTDFTNGGAGCSALETSATGALTCGTDDTGSGGAKTITLHPEYPGATLTASGSATINGSLTSDIDSGGAANWRNYYSWTSSQTSLQDYTVAVRVKLPSDFGTWATSNAFVINYVTQATSTASNKIDVTLYNETDTSGNPIAQIAGVASGVAGTWTSSAIDDSILDNNSAPDWDASSSTAIILIKMYSKDSNYVRIGDITLNYNAL